MQFNANSESEKFVNRLVKREEECLSMISISMIAQCGYKGYSMANIEYISDNKASKYIGTCWCQKGKHLIGNGEPCCKTIRGSNCDIQCTYSDIHLPLAM